MILGFKAHTSTHTQCTHGLATDRQRFPVNGAVIKCLLMDSVVRQTTSSRDWQHCAVTLSGPALRLFAPSGSDSITFDVRISTFTTAAEQDAAGVYELWRFGDRQNRK